MKKMLIISKITDAKDFMEIFEKQGVDIKQTEDGREALKIALSWNPGVILFITPVYWESILEFVEKIRAVPEMERTGIMYIGRMIEGAELRLLQQYDVNTMALGPVPKEEMARFIYGMFPAW